MSIFSSKTTAAVWRRWAYKALRTRSKSVTVFSPVAGDSITLWVTKVPITITKISSHRQAGTSIAINIEHGTNPANPGSSLWASNQTVTDETIVDQNFDAFVNAAVATNNVIKFEITSVIGNVQEAHVTVEYVEEEG